MAVLAFRFTPNAQLVPFFGLSILAVQKLELLKEISHFVHSAHGQAIPTLPCSHIATDTNMAVKHGALVGF